MMKRFTIIVFIERSCNAL